MATVKTVKKAKARKGAAVAKRKAAPQAPKAESEKLTAAQDSFLVWLAQQQGGAAPRSVAVTYFSTLLSSWPLTEHDWADVLHLQPRTIATRIKERRGFEGLEADRVRMVEQVMERGREVFGNKEKFARWLDSPLPVLHGRKPKELLVSSNGMGLVMAELGRIEHGVF